MFVLPMPLARHKCGMFVPSSSNALGNISLNNGLVRCSDPACRDPQHLAEISAMHDAITDALHSAASVFVARRDKRFKQVPGWNEYVKEAHSEARDAFLLWRSNGKPRTGALIWSS